MARDNTWWPPCPFLRSRTVSAGFLGVHSRAFFRNKNAKFTDSYVHYSLSKYRAFWGGERTIGCALQNQFWRAQKVGLVWSVHVPSKQNDGKRIIGGGVQAVFGEGFYCMFPPVLAQKHKLSALVRVRSTPGQPAV